MPISRIVAEIDSYLFRLRQARELLAGSEKVARQRHASRKRVATRVTEAISVPSPVVRIQPIKVRQKVEQQTMNAANKAVDLVVMPDTITAALDVSFQPEAASLAQRMPSVSRVAARSKLRLWNEQNQ
jgi:monoamine oxidase